MSTSFGIARSLLSLSASLLLALSTLSACDKKADAPAPTSSASSAASTSPTATVTPHSGTAEVPAASSANGPSEAGTAIGGMVGQQEKGGAKKGDAPAATSGDGAAPSK